MKKIFLPAIISTFFLSFSSFAQEYSYTHYSITEGLAGSILYCITQDKDGFIWTGTEAGVSRFDGTHFKNFTTRDGLPDLEILQIFGDSKGRVWMAPFRKSVCYYYRGKIHNQQNDSLLSHIQLQGNIESFTEDAHGNISIQERNALYLVDAKDSLIHFDSLGKEPIRECLAVSNSASGNFLAQVSGKIIEFSAKGPLHSIGIPLFTPNPNFMAMNSSRIVWIESATRFVIRSLVKNEMINLPLDSLHYRHISFSILDDSLLYSNESSGTLEYNINTRQTRKFLPGITVSRVFRDRTGNRWFATIGEGLFRLNSNEIRTISLTPENNERSGISAITKISNQLWIGDNHNYIFRLSLPDLAVLKARPIAHYMTCRILFLDSINKDMTLAGSDYGVTECTRDGHFIRAFVGGMKSAVRIDDRHLLVAYFWGAGILDLPSFQIKDTLFRERSTVVFYKEDTTYLGTLNGLYRSVKGQPLFFLGTTIPFLKKRIASIAESADGTLWIASYDDAGIIGFKDNRQVATITRQQGLTSDICRTLTIHNNVLWAGTDRGLNRIELDRPGYPVTQYTAQDGLASDMVNTVFIDNSRVYVGTSAGLSFFDEGRRATGEECSLYLLSLINSERERITDTGDLVIPWNDRRVRFDFAAISYRSAGDITYKYRMAGLDNTWRTTKENFLEYPDLPSGNYEWQLIAVNKFGNQSRLLSLPVKVSIQFWKRTGFTVTFWILSLLLLWGMVSQRIRYIRRQQREKDELTQKMSELENIALKSQMNPHFIFNCLHSVQKYIFDGDTTGANKYIAGLAKLIRITLQNSSKAFVCIEDEVDYLSSYLSLEKIRFKDKIDYQLVIDSSIDRSATLIPPMLIQPYVENSLQHGLPHKEGEKGLISIRMNKDNQSLVVTVEDNGVGIKKAAAKKDLSPIEHQSKGMTLTKDRIGLMNKLYGGNTHVEVMDLTDETGHSKGTRITIRLPLFSEQSLYF